MNLHSYSAKPMFHMWNRREMLMTHCDSSIQFHLIGSSVSDEDSKHDLCLVILATTDAENFIHKINS
jgi:hypothetical protein